MTVAQLTGFQVDPEVDLGFGPEDLEALFEMQMPYGRYRGRFLIDLPEEYLLWFERSSFPNGNLGRWMRLSLGIKRHGAEPAVKQVRTRLQDRQRPSRGIPWDRS